MGSDISVVEFDFEGNAKEGIAVDWPIRYEDMAPWYDYVEEYIGKKYSKLCISFLDPKEFGLGALDINASTAICARVTDMDTGVKIANLLHYVENNDIGSKMQSYFWLGIRLRPF